MTARLRRIYVSYLLDEVARWTGNTYIMRLTDQNQKQVEILKILSRIPVCLILDNLETTTDKTIYEFVEAVPYPSRVVVTSRRRHLELPSARHLEVPPISDGSSLELLHNEIGSIQMPVIEQSPLLERLESFTKCNPLAIKWAVGQLQVLPLSSLVEILERGQGDLFEKMFDTSWVSISEASRNILAALTRFKSPPAVPSIMAVADVPSRRQNATITELRSLRLLECSEVGDNVQYTLHPLAQSFAAAKFGELDAAEHQAFNTRFIHYYLESASQRGGRDWDDPEPLEQIDMERENYVHATRLAFESERWADVLSLAEALRNYLLIYGYWRQRLDLCRLGLSAAEELNNLQTRGRFLRHIGWTMVLQSELHEAETYLAEAREVAVSEVDHKGEADATGDLAEVWRLRVDLLQARKPPSTSS